MSSHLRSSNSLSGFDIISLSEKPDFADICAAWSFSQWVCQLGTRSLTQVIEDYRRTAANDAELPVTWLALRAGKPAGMVRLKLNDHPDRPDLNPWLGSLFVHPEHRGRGIAGALCRHVQSQAGSIYGCGKLYLFTGSALSLYTKLGWSQIGTVRDTMGLHPEGEALMEKVLTDDV